MRRFIAGAVCPACRAEDRTVLERLVDGRRRLCVACGHEEMEDLRPSAAVPEPAGRFNRAPAVSEAVPVRLFAPAAAVNHPPASLRAPLEKTDPEP